MNNGERFASLRALQAQEADPRGVFLLTCPRRRLIMRATSCSPPRGYVGTYTRDNRAAVEKTPSGLTVRHGVLLYVCESVCMIPGRLIPAEQSQWDAPRASEKVMYLRPKRERDREREMIRVCVCVRVWV